MGKEREKQNQKMVWVANKPGSVPQAVCTSQGDDHSSAINVTADL